MKIFCVGRNYALHARELNNEVPAEPVIFMKPATALLKDGADFFYPDFSSSIHYECELVLRISKHGKHVQEKFAHKYFDALTVGIDFTARDIQAKLKDKGLPWEISKAFDGSAVVGKFVESNSFSSADSILFSLKKNGALVQQGNSHDMIFSFEKIISYVSSFFTLQKGDLIYTGTPAGVGEVQKGDLLEGFIHEQKVMECNVK